jgi:hybrid cluster-associated redox disulfide protein
MEVKKDMLIGELIRKKPEAIETLMQFGMGCVGCPSSQMESLEEAAMVHGLNLDSLMEALNK